MLRPPPYGQNKPLHSGGRSAIPGKIKRVIVALISVAAIGGPVVTATAAHAGTNSQHISFQPGSAHGDLPGQLDYVQITGQNQYGGGPVQWWGRSTDGHSLTLGNGWWWRGTVTLRWYVKGSNVQHVTTAWIPWDNRGGYQVAPDTVVVNSLGTLYWGTSAAMELSEGYGWMSCGAGLFGAYSHYIKWIWWTGYYYDAGHNIQGRSWIGGTVNGHGTGGGPEFPFGEPIDIHSTGSMLTCA